jgi:hypothetical protein
MFGLEKKQFSNQHLVEISTQQQTENYYPL